MITALATVRALLDAWNSGDVDAIIDQFDPECEVVFRPEVPEPGPFRGHDELRGWVEGFRFAMGSSVAELTEVLADAPQTAVVTLHFRGTGAGSGIPIELRWANVFDVSGGRIVRWRDFNDPEEALEAAGLAA